MCPSGSPIVPTYVVPLMAYKWRYNKTNFKMHSNRAPIHVWYTHGTQFFYTVHYYLTVCLVCLIAVQEVGTESVRPNSGHPRYARCEYNIYPPSPHVSSSHSMCINITHRRNVPSINKFNIIAVLYMFIYLTWRTATPSTVLTSSTPSTTQ